ncbi:hypothetical protein [Nonomuraea sp. NPDC049709]|uniref:zinc finger domain-containing protein n=1 Tax=Nonomuraea sp. NPDC049709 TaxID=3154736 RepID=UPI003423577E
MTGSEPARQLPQLAVACPTCHAATGDLCTSHGGTRPRRNDTHQTRTAAWREADLAQRDETHPTPGRYQVTYERVGRRRDIPPLIVEAAGADHLAKLVHTDARRYLGSRDVEVRVDLEEMRGSILCGMRSGGQFTVERLDGGR